ncbi:Glycosyl hydrolases family 2 [Granulicella pectinivorans]|uniref:Glycosyl hydrolases family 2 n=1 Tax=Granulicella pectinivorans TaxID=474950 RepID=A0A1I6LY12_9BACT|nr:Glycosyl hydrolases family 2 [Granulicella pectinivorans]
MKGSHMMGISAAFGVGVVDRAAASRCKLKGTWHPAPLAARRTIRRICGFLIWVLAIALATSPGLAQRANYNFNEGWRLDVGDPSGAEKPLFDDASWKSVTLPHAWNEDYAYRVSIHDQPTGIAWYRKHFRLPAMAPDSRVLIEFQGVRLAAEVYLNGEWLGRSENGVMAFGFDLTSHLKPGENILAVRTDNRWDYREKATNSPIQWNNSNFYSNFGGINKNVRLHIVPAVHQTLPLYSSLGTIGQYVWAEGFDLAKHLATVHVESQIRNDSKAARTVRLYAEVRELNGKLVASSTSAAVTLDAGGIGVLKTQTVAHDLHFWSWGYGYLYDVVTALLIDGKPSDAVTTRTGFRQTAFHDGMIFLNGRVMQIHGYAARSTNEWPGLGTDVPPWVSDFSNGLMVSDNANLVRWMHVTPSKQDIESCDRVGLPQSMPAGDAEGDPKGREWEARVELMRDSIVYNRNNPSILFYESGNKGIREEHMQDMLQVRNQFDPHGGRAIGSREMLASHSAEYGGEMLYIDKSATKPLWAHEYNRDEGARKFWNEATPPFHKDSPLYNRNQDSFTLEDIRRWDDYFRVRPGTGKRVSAGGVNISWIDENSHFRGDNNYRRSGEVDAMRLPKDAFYAHQTMWDGWVTPERPHIHITGHWNYAAGTVRTVYVVATTAEVELKLNGRSLGRQKPTHDFLFTFADIPFQAGALEAVGYDTRGKTVLKDHLASTGQPVALRLTRHIAPGGMHADGSDLALVDVEAIDVLGRRVPTALNMVHFRITGNGEWRGGIAEGSSQPVPVNTQTSNAPGMSPTPVAPFLHDDNFILSPNLPVEGGINRVSVRSTTQPGTIRLIAESDGLKSAEVTLTTLPVIQKDGLSRFEPTSSLPVRLERGPTPLGASFTITRTPIEIVASDAGRNSESARRSYDDNETTFWSNASVTRTDMDTDGYPIRHAEPDARPVSAMLDQAWIEYTLAEPSIPESMDLKLGSFRLRRYPLRITLDGDTVYQGLTPTSLGYITLPLHTAKPGTHLRIQLTDSPMDVEEVHQLVEVNGKVDQAEPTGKQSAPVLSILEAEIYTTK